MRGERSDSVSSPRRFPVSLPPTTGNRLLALRALAFLAPIAAIVLHGCETTDRSIGVVAFVGDEACRSCHAEIYEGFQRTGMGRSFALPSKDGIVADYSGNRHVYDPLSDLHYEVSFRDGRFLQREYREDERGRVIHELEREVDYVIGSGEHTRSFLASENGVLYQLPVTWYSDRGVWDLSPGYHEQNPRFSRRITRECMNCHNSYPDHVRNTEQTFREPLPEGIGCERCHGPGAEHVRWRDQNPGYQAEGDVSDPTIVNPKRLDHAEQMDVCLQCHLSGEMSVDRDQVDPSSFRPGMRLSSVKQVYIDDRIEPDNFRIASHGARFPLSRCYLQSDGELTCTTCHDPHWPVGETPRGTFDAVCVGCHAVAGLTTDVKEHARSGDCVRCHMRQGETSDIPHVNFTDHWIRRGVGSPAVAEGVTPDQDRVRLVEFFGDTEGSLTDLGVANAKLFEAKSGDSLHLELAIEQLEEGLRKETGHQNGRYFLAKCYSHQGRYREAERLLRESISSLPESGRTHFALGTALERQGRFEEAAEVYERTLELDPASFLALNNLGLSLVQLGRIEEARAAFESAIAVQPSFSEASANLGFLRLHILGDPEGARADLDRALHLDPEFHMARHTRALLDLAVGDTTEAVRQFERILGVDPGFLPAHGNLAVIYESRGRSEKALYHVEELLSQAPEDKRAIAMLERLQAGR